MGGFQTSLLLTRTFLMLSEFNLSYKAGSSNVVPNSKPWEDYFPHIRFANPVYFHTRVKNESLSRVLNNRTGRVQGASVRGAETALAAAWGVWSLRPAIAGSL